MANVTNNMMDECTEKTKKLRIVKPFVNDSHIQTNKKHWEKVLDEIDPSVYTKEKESKQISEVLPRNLYEKVCVTLGIPIIAIGNEEPKKQPEPGPRKIIKEPLLSYRKALYIERDADSDTDVELSPSEDEHEPNIHQELLSKPLREQVTWPTHFLKPEREDEKSLVKKADDLTDRIAQDFCEYMQQLGGNQQSQLFTPKAIKELFQIEFDTHIARSLRVVPKELPSVVDKVAQATGNPDKSKSATLEREVLKDIKAERRRDNVKAFGRSLPRKDQYQAPRNDTKNQWRSARRVPKDLVTLKTVWEGITNLRSVKEYCRWMIDHPEHRRAPYLRSLGMFDTAVLDARQSYELNNMFEQPLTSLNDDPAPIDHIRKRLSDLADTY